MNNNDDNGDYRYVAASPHDAPSDAALYVSHGGGGRGWASPGIRAPCAATHPPPLALTLPFPSHDESSGSPVGSHDERDGESDLTNPFFLAPRPKLFKLE